MTQEEIETYDSFALDLARGADIVERSTYEFIFDSRRKKLVKYWLAGRKGLILDYGCGDGSFSRFINEELKTEVIGVDVSGKMIRYASSRKKNVIYLISDCHSLPFTSESFDVVIGIGVFHHLNLQKAMYECRRILKKDGLLIAFEPNSLGLLAFLGRKLFRTKIHTSNERTFTHWSFTKEMKTYGFIVTDVRFLSFLGFIFPFIWASKFAYLFGFLKSYTQLLREVDKLFERIPMTKYLCWQLAAIGVK